MRQTEKEIFMKTKNKDEQSVKKKKSRGKLLLKILAIILCVILALGVLSAAATLIGDKATTKKAQSFSPVAYTQQLVPERDENGYWTFTTDRQFKILQLTDVHIGGGWMSLKKDSMSINAVAAMVTAEQPDLVVVTGDVSYPVPFQAGTFNNKLSAEIFAELMETLGVYWTITMGNHDTEAYSYYSRESIGRLYESEKYAHCLFELGDENVDGVGNQVINIKNTDGYITQSIFTIDSHSYTDGDFLGIMWKYDNIHDNQVAWYSKTIDALNELNNKLYKENGLNEKSDIKSLAFFHIPLTEMKDAWDEYAENGYRDTENVKLIYGVAGETGKVVYSGMHEDGFFEAMQEKGSTQGIFFGHDHKNNLSFEYKGIRMTYGMSVDYLAYPGIYKLGSQRGCTVITVEPDGSFDCRAESYYQDKYQSLYEKESVTMQEVTYEQQ